MTLSICISQFARGPIGIYSMIMKEKKDPRETFWPSFIFQCDEHFEQVILNDNGF